MSVPNRGLPRELAKGLSLASKRGRHRLRTTLAAWQSPSGSQVQELFRQFPESLRVGRPGQNRFDFPAQYLPLQRLALVLMRRPARLRVPGALTAIYQALLRPLPGPRLYRTVQPAIEVERPHVGIHVAQLLLAGPPHFFHVLERL